MRKLILFFLTLSIIAAGFITAAAQKRRFAKQKTREASIYLLNYAEADSNVPTLIEVKRRVNVRTPLAGAIRAFLAGATGTEEEKELSGVNNGLLLVSVSVKNKRVRIDLTYEKAKYKDDSEEYRWGATTREFFPEAIEKTALQFPGIKEVLVCVDGIENYTTEDEFYQTKCPKKWWESRGN